LNTTALAFKSAIATRKPFDIYNEKLIISFIKGCRLFFKLCASTQTATQFAPDKLLYRKIFMGSAQTRKPLKRLDLNF